MKSSHVENIDFGGKAIVVTSEQGWDVTVIDGNGAGSVAVFRNGEGPGSVLDGFTLTQGSGTVVSNVTLGGGVFCSGASPTISNNAISGNSADVGGGIFMYDSSTVVTNNTLSANMANGELADYIGGGGMSCFNSSPTITNNRIRDNSANSAFLSGGGIQCHECTLFINKNEITENVAGSGGGVNISLSDGEISGNRVSENQALHAEDGDGGGSC